MPRPKQMIKSCEVEIARARRTCAFTNAPILKGTPCLVVYEGHRDRFCYSPDVAFQMIKQARIRLEEVEQQLTGSLGSEAELKGDGAQLMPPTSPT